MEFKYQLFQRLPEQLYFAQIFICLDNITPLSVYLDQCELRYTDSIQNQMREEIESRFTSNQLKLFYNNTREDIESKTTKQFDSLFEYISPIFEQEVVQ